MIVPAAGVVRSWWVLWTGSSFSLGVGNLPSSLHAQTHTHTHARAHASSWMRFTRSSTGLSKQLISERLQLGGVSLLSSGHLHAGIRQPTQRDTLTRLPYVITHDTAVRVCVCLQWSCWYTLSLHQMVLHQLGSAFFPLWQNPKLTTQPFRAAPAR